MNRPLTGAGGIVVRETERGPEILVGRRRANGEWRLPKGKIDPGETPEAAAVREIREETGVEVTIRSLIGDDIRRDGRKRIRFFLCTTERPSHPYTDPEFDVIHWVPAVVAVSIVGADGERRLIADYLADRDALLNPAA